MSIKTATLDDLLRQLNAHDKRRPDYMVWLGAGASVTSAIPTASGIVAGLLRRVYAQHNGLSLDETMQIPDEDIHRWAAANLKWFNPNDLNKSEYVQVMENVYQSPGIRVRYLRELTRNASPSDGYKYLGMLLAASVFDTVITTNFDHLIRQAADSLLPVPLVEINALEQYPALAPYPDEPRIIRLHGDFWHNNVLNTEGELERIPQIRYEAVTRLLHSYGLIVLGYSGSDRGLMDKLFQPLTQNHNIGKNGIYWCYRKGSPLSPRVEMFLEKAPEGYAYLVEIDDFDTAMAKIAAQFGLKLPLAEGLQAQLKDLQAQLAFAWDWQALLAQFVQDQLTGLTNIQLQTNLCQLSSTLQSIQAILARKDPTTPNWFVVAAANLSIDQDARQISEPLLVKLIGNQQNIIRFIPDESASNDPIFQGFIEDHIIELFAVWHNNQLQGFIAFNSLRSVIDNHEVKLVRAAVQLLVMMPNIL